MTMIIPLLVASVAVGLSWAQEPPEYKENLEAFRDASGALIRNLLSMEGNIPLLNDSRRHYAEIVNVIDHHAYMLSLLKSLDRVSPYYQNYYPYLNISAPEAISNPEKVVTKIQHFLDAVEKKADKLIEFIDSCILDFAVCNVFIDEAVKEDEEEYGHQSQLLLTVGKASSKYNDLNEKFEEVSNNLSAHHFVITSPQDLQDIVFAVAEVHRVIGPIA